jgi:hypothetical protein
MDCVGQTSQCFKIHFLLLQRRRADFVHPFKLLSKLRNSPYATNENAGGIEK